MEEKKIDYPFPWDKEKHIKGTVYYIPKDEALGYSCGYSLFIPEGCEMNTTLLVHACNTGNNVPRHLEEANQIVKESVAEPNHGIWFSSDLKMPLLIPLFPRVQGYYTQALGSKVYHNDVSILREDQEWRSPDHRLTEEEIKNIQLQCRNIPEQLANMIIASKSVLEHLGIQVDKKVIIEGYSAGGKFSNLFTALHPELVKACVSGGNGGLGIIPRKELHGEILNFPLGVSDISNFDEKAFQEIPKLFYIGTEDYNDPAMYLCEFQMENGEYVLNSEGNRIPVTDETGTIIPVLDEKGRLQPRYLECYTQEEIEQIHRLMGENPQIRFNFNERIYQELGMNAQFQRFPGTHNSVTQAHDKNYRFTTNECVYQFIREVLQKELHKQK